MILFNSFAVIEYDAERAINRRPRGIVAQMIRVHGTVYIIEDVVNAQLYAVGQHPVLPAKVVSGVDAPYLESLSVTVVLIVAFAATATGKADA